MMVSGTWAELGARADSRIPREKFMMGSGLMIKHMARAFMCIQMERGMKVIGDKIYNMVWGKRHGLMAPCLSGNTLMARRMALGNTSGQTGHLTRVNGLTMKSAVMGFISGRTAGSISVIGVPILWMILEYTRGKMEGHTKGTIKMIRSMDMVFIPGQIKRNMLVGGPMVSNTA